MKSKIKNLLSIFTCLAVTISMLAFPLYNSSALAANELTDINAIYKHMDNKNIIDIRTTKTDLKNVTIADINPLITNTAVKKYKDIGGRVQLEIDILKLVNGLSTVYRTDPSSFVKYNETNKAELTRLFGSDVNIFTFMALFNSMHDDMESISFNAVLNFSSTQKEIVKSMQNELDKSFRKEIFKNENKAIKEALDKLGWTPVISNPIMNFYDSIAKKLDSNGDAQMGILYPAIRNLFYVAGREGEQISRDAIINGTSTKDALGRNIAGTITVSRPTFLESLAGGKHLDIDFVVRDLVGGSDTPFNIFVKWDSSNSNVVTIDALARIMAKKPGTAIITAYRPSNDGQTNPDKDWLYVFEVVVK